MYTGGAVFRVTFATDEDNDVELATETKGCLLFDLATVYEADCGKDGIVKGAEADCTDEVFMIKVT